MHTLWMREHNRIANELQKKAKNAHFWNDERLFQETRRIVIAEYQHIIYNEWLPVVIGKQYMTNAGLLPLSEGHSDQYLDTFDPRITNEFATAAFRFGHSLIPSSFHMDNGITLDLKDIFFKPEKIRNEPREYIPVQPQKGAWQIWASLSLRTTQVPSGLLYIIREQSNSV